MRILETYLKRSQREQLMSFNNQFQSYFVIYHLRNIHITLMIWYIRKCKRPYLYGLR